MICMQTKKSRIIARIEKILDSQASFLFVDPSPIVLFGIVCAYKAYKRLKKKIGERKEYNVHKKTHFSNVRNRLSKYSEKKHKEQHERELKKIRNTIYDKANIVNPTKAIIEKYGIDIADLYLWVKKWGGKNIQQTLQAGKYRGFVFTGPESTVLNETLGYLDGIREISDKYNKLIKNGYI